MNSAVVEVRMSPPLVPSDDSRTTGCLHPFLHFAIHWPCRVLQAVMYAAKGHCPDMDAGTLKKVQHFF